MEEQVRDELEIEVVVEVSVLLDVATSLCLQALKFLNLGNHFQKHMK